MKSAAKNRPILNEKACFEKLHFINQESLLDHWSTLSLQQKENLCRQITDLDLDLFKKQRKTLATTENESRYLEPFKEYTQAGNLDDKLMGFDLAAKGKIALLVLAGGQGSRMHCEAPKGCYAISLVKKKTLFQLLAEKVLAVGKLLGRSVEVGIMTSPLNHNETKNFFEQNQFFGLNTHQITFFKQRIWPLLDLSGNLFLESPDQIAFGPNGNGEIFNLIVNLGIWSQWKKLGVEAVNILPVDNPLADPFDFEFFGFFFRHGCDVAIKASERRNPNENLGMLAVIDGKTTVIEYSEMSLEKKNERNRDGELKFNIANLGLLCFSMEFIKEVSGKKLPLHKAKKSVKVVSKNNTQSQKAWKFERFIFDVLPFARYVKALLYPRELCFAPLKNLVGEDSIVSVQKALLAFDHQIFTKVTGKAPPAHAQFELAPQFYYPTPELLEKWKGRPFPKEDYIHE